MTVRATVTLKNGQTLQGMNFRLAGYAPPYNPSVPASPSPFNGGIYHLQTSMGWVEINANDVDSISTLPVAYR